MKSQHEYEQAAEDVIQYIEARLDGGRGQRLSIEDKEDLRAAFEQYGWRDKGGASKPVSRNTPLSNFIEVALNTRAADRVVQRGSLGHFGAKTSIPSSRRHENSSPIDDKRAVAARQQGKSVYKHPGGYAVKSKNGRFLDTKTGRFVSGRSVKE